MTVLVIPLLSLFLLAGLVLATLRVVWHDVPSRSHQPPRSHDADPFTSVSDGGPAWH